MSTLRRLVNQVRYTIAGMRVMFDRDLQTVEETMAELNSLRRRYGLKEWEL